MNLRLMTAGESHGPALTAIVEGLPAGLPLEVGHGGSTSVMINLRPRYEQMPPWMQTIAVNVASAPSLPVKYGLGFSRTYHRLAHNELKSRGQLLEEQQAALHDLLRFAVEHVPFYRERKLPPDDFGAWPVVDKKTVTAAPEKFLSDNFNPGDLLTIKTSGTTGLPLGIYLTRRYSQMETAFRWRHRGWGCVRLFGNGAYISGHPVVPVNQRQPPFWRMDRFERRLLFSSHHLEPQNLGHYVQALFRYRPHFVQGYPSALYLLAGYMMEAGVEPLRPRAVFSVGQVLANFQREAIQQAFGAKVLNWYGNNEFTCNIIECAAGNLHYRTDYGLLEIQPDGVMICTGLNNLAMPLIRYRIGDVATPKKGYCPCGCAFPLIERIEGRIEHCIRMPDGRYTARLDHLLKAVRHVRDVQIVQPRPEELLVRMVHDTGYGPDDERTIVAEVRRRLGDSIQIRFEYVESIQRAPAEREALARGTEPYESVDLMWRDFAPQQPAVRQRYALGYWIYIRRLRRSQWRTTDELRAEQFAKLQSLLRDAYENVPYYRRAFREIGATPDDFKELTDLSKLPVLQKATVRERLEQFINPRHDPHTVFEDHTSGSTGTPLRVLLTFEQKAYEMAYNIRFYQWAGYRTAARIAAFRHYIPKTEHDALWKLDRRINTLFFSVYDMKPVNLRAYVEQFNRFRPQFVRGYPSSIYIFTQFALSEGLSLHAPRAVLSSSETLSDEMRTVIERALQCPVYDWWGSNERVATACQCEKRGSYHINCEGGIVELVSQPDNTGQRGHHIVATGLINHAMPLIRYDLGDLAEPASQPCPCGRGLPCIGRILGRVNDLIVTGEQKFIPSVRFYTLFETHAKVRQFQIVQTEPNAVVVRLALARPLTDGELSELREKLGRFLGAAVRLDFSFVDEITPEATGKIRNIISLVNRTHPAATGA